MMVETMLESAQDFGQGCHLNCLSGGCRYDIGYAHPASRAAANSTPIHPSMSNGALPQWKRELLQRRAARSRPAPPPAQPPPPPGDDDDEELRYGPGIVKRLKSRYLSLALRDAPRRRPSVLRRAASLEHLLDERPPPAPRPPAARPPRPASIAMPPATGGFSMRRESVKRARSVDALSRLESREEPQLPPSPSPPPPPPPSSSPPVAPPLPAPRPPPARSARPPRRPTPLLRETERPPPDVVRSTLRKFESAPTRRAAPAARVSAVLRGLEGPRTSTPEPRELADCRSPSPVAADVSAIDETEGAVVSAEARPVSRAALEGIARAGSSMRFSFEAPRRGSHLPPLAAANPVLVGRARRVGVIRPMPAPSRARVTSTPTPPPLTAEIEEKITEVPPRIATPPPVETESTLPVRTERREPPPSALVEPIVRSPPEERAPTPLVESPRSSSREVTPELTETTEPEITKPLMNGHSNKSKISSVHSRLGGADIERAWNGTPEKKEQKKEIEEKPVAPWAKLATGQNGSAGSPPARRARAPAPAATSVVFNFSDRKEVPDYIENDGLILRASRRNKFKPGEPGIVVLRPEALAPSSDSEEEAGPPSPCGVRFVNDNVLINGKSSMPLKPNRERQAKLKLQFDDSLTRTFEYPSETSLCSPDERPAPAPAQGGDDTDTPPHPAQLTANTHIVSAALARYTPSKTVADAFQLGVTRRPDTEVSVPSDEACCAGAECEAGAGGACAGSGTGCGAGDARPCGADARSWSEARTHTTDLLF